MSTLPGPSCGEAREDRKKKRQPKDYSDAVWKHSTRAKEYFLHSGIHYRFFAQFLNGSLHRGPSAGNYTLSTWRAHTFAAIHNLVYDLDDPNRVTYFDSTEGLDKFATYPFPQNNCGQLLFLRGYPSPRWVQIIGARYGVDAEFFRRHLSVGQNSELYDIPVLPSASRNIVKLSITSIGKHSAIRSRFNDIESLQAHHQSLGSRDSLVGESVVRRFSVHDKTHFTIEQDVSICVLRRGAGWIAIILLDCGRDLDENLAGPWVDRSFQIRRFDNVFNPVLLFEPNIFIRNGEKAEAEIPPGVTQSSSKRSFQQSSSLLHTNSYGRFISPNVMKVDAFYALSELFNFAACAESQFLSLLKTKFLSETHLHNQEEHMQEYLLDLKKHKLIIHEHIQQIRSVIAIIEEGGSSKWPRVEPVLVKELLKSTCRSEKDSNQKCILEDPVTEPKKSQEQSTLNAESDVMTGRLLKDYQALLSHAHSISDLYSEGMRDIRDNAMLAESRKAIEQARGVGHLTLLAYLFLPLSFTSALFGMNFNELNGLSIWVWVVVSVPVFLLAATLCFWHILAPLLSRIQVLIRHCCTLVAQAS